jgi:hypothetical protein
MAIEVQLMAIEVQKALQQCKPGLFFPFSPTNDGD